LPPTLRARLDLYSLDTFSSGRRASDTLPDGTETSPSLRVLDVEITTADAAEIERKIKDAEQAALAALDEADEAR